MNGAASVRRTWWNPSEQKSRLMESIIDLVEIDKAGAECDAFLRRMKQRRAARLLTRSFVEPIGVDEMSKANETETVPLSNITLAQAGELRNEITKLNAELYQAKFELHRARTELIQRQQHVDRDQKTYADNRAYTERLQEELLAARERNITLRDKLLAVQRAMIE